MRMYFNFDILNVFAGTTPHVRHLFERLDQLRVKTSRHIADLIVDRRDLELQAVHALNVEVPKLDLPDKEIDDWRNARMVRGDLKLIHDYVTAEPLDKGSVIKLVEAATSAWTRVYEAPRPDDLEKLLRHLGVLVQRLKGELPDTFEKRTVASHIVETRSLLTGLEHACSEVRPELERIKGCRGDVDAHLQEAERSHTFWRQAAEEYEAQLKKATEEMARCVESIDAAARSLQAYDNAVKAQTNSVSKLEGRRDEVHAYLKRLSKEGKRQDTAALPEVALILSYAKELVGNNASKD